MLRTALAALAALSIAAAPPEARVSRIESLEPLKGLEPFEVTLVGEAEESFLAKRKCVYFEWSYGEAQPDGSWGTHWRGYQSDKPLLVRTPKGEVELGIGQVRTHLAPAFDHTWQPAEAAAAPEAVREELKQGPINAKEFCLEPGKTYYARVVEEAFHLPPRPGSAKPQRRTQLQLQLSDKPFVDGKPPLPVTPGFKGWTH